MRSPAPHPDDIPLRELARVDEIVDCDGWVDNETFVVNREIQIRRSDGAPYDLLSAVEQQMLDADSSLARISDRNVTLQTPRPSPLNQTFLWPHLPIVHRVSALILEEIADERRWDDAFDGSQPQLAQLAEKVRADIRAGRVRDAGIDEL